MLFQVILAKGQTDKEIRKRKLAAEEKEDEQKKEKKDTSEMSTDVASGEKVEFFITFVIQSGIYPKVLKYWDT